MIIYFADRRMNILGQASTALPEGLCIKDDKKTEEVEAGVGILEFDLCFTRRHERRCRNMGKSWKLHLKKKW